MKKVQNNEQMKIFGGTYTYSQVCSGTHKYNKRRHDTKVSGSGSTVTAAKKAYNSNLAAHKNSNTMANMSHNRYPVSV